MSDPQQSWSNNPNAPKISHGLYFTEKSRFAGVFLGSILYGILIVLFFQCMVALLHPANRGREGIRWLISYTVAMFSFATILTGTGLHLYSICYVDNREYPGVEGKISPGPLGYRSLISPGAVSMTERLMSHLNYWLADGYLLYRCYMLCFNAQDILWVWAVVFPSVMYLATVGTGVMTLVSQALEWADTRPSLNLNISIAYTSISVALNVLLTLTIVARLLLHSGQVRAVTGSTAGGSRLYVTIATMLIESSALYAANSLLLIGLWAAGNGAQYIFLHTLDEIQVIAPLLIVKRVANNSALTGTAAPGRIGSSKAGGWREPTGGSFLPISGGHMRLVGDDEKGFRGSGAGVTTQGTIVDIRRDYEL